MLQLTRTVKRPFLSIVTRFGNLVLEAAAVELLAALDLLFLLFFSNFASNFTSDY